MMCGGMEIIGYLESDLEEGRSVREQGREKKKGKSGVLCYIHTSDIIQQIQHENITTHTVADKGHSSSDALSPALPLAPSIS